LWSWRWRTVIMTLEEALTAALEKRACASCNHAIVGRGEKVRCAEGYFDGLTLREVARRKCKCEDYEAAE
jgi:hypothetical protein